MTDEQKKLLQVINYSMEKSGEEPKAVYIVSGLIKATFDSDAAFEKFVVSNGLIAEPAEEKSGKARVVKFTKA